MSLEGRLEEKEVDAIENHWDFYAAECDVAHDYCDEREFNISDDDFDCLANRGLLGTFLLWKEDYEESLCDGSVVATYGLGNRMKLIFYCLRGGIKHETNCSK